MLEFILDNFWACLAVSCIPYLIVKPWSMYKSKQADKKLISDLAKILKDDLGEPNHNGSKT